MSFDKEVLGTAKHFSNSIEKRGDRYGSYRQFQEIRSLVISSHYKRDDLDSRPEFMCDVVTEFISDVHDDGFIEIPEEHNIGIVTYAVDMFIDWFDGNEKYDYVLDTYDIDEFIKFFLMNVSWRVDGFRGVKCLHV